MMKRRQFIRALAAAAWAVVGAAGTTAASAQAPSTTVIVVRHAEKATQPANDPTLTADGRGRADALAQALKDAGVTAIITSQFERTKETAQPTAELFHLTPQTVPAGSGSVTDDARAVAMAVMQHAGGTVLVVGHSNTIPDIVQALGAARPAEICDAEYDGMYVVTVAPGGGAHVVHARYGRATPVGKDCSAMMMK